MHHRYAAEASSALVGATFLFDALVGVFMAELIERVETFRPGFLFAACCSVGSSLLLLAALQLERVSLLLLAIALFTMGVQMCLQLATSLVTTLSSVAPQRSQGFDAAMLLSMNLSGVLGALTIWLAPINPGRNGVDAPSRLWEWLDDTLPRSWEQRLHTLSTACSEQLDRLGLSGVSLTAAVPEGVDVTAIYIHLALRHGAE